MDDKFLLAPNHLHPTPVSHTSPLKQGPKTGSQSAVSEPVAYAILVSLVKVT
jgi:hypothetical protein